MGVFQSKEQPNYISYGNIQEEGSIPLPTDNNSSGSGVSIKSKAEAKAKAEAEAKAKNVHTVHFTQHI